MDIKPYLPSPQFQRTVGFILLGILIIVLIGFGLDFLKKRMLVSTIEKIGGVDVLVKDTVEQDTDGDTIPDWEEKLWGLDPLNPDTNGDGISDAVEINQKRQESAKELGLTGSENLSETDQFARELFLTAAGFSEVGEISELDAESIAQSALAQVGEVTTETFYTADDFKQTTKKDSETVRAYSSKITNSLNCFNPGDDLTVIALTKAMQSNNPTDLAPLDNFIIGYTVCSNNLKTITVPTIFIGSHTKITNAYKGLSESIKGMKNVFENPVGTLQAIVLYDKYLNMFQEGMEQYTNILVPYIK
jgi:hypothetical protein